MDLYVIRIGDVVMAYLIATNHQSQALQDHYHTPLHLLLLLLPLPFQSLLFLLHLLDCLVEHFLTTVQDDRKLLKHEKCLETVVLTDSKER
jgi:hypothetical protein